MLPTVLVAVDSSSCARVQLSLRKQCLVHNMELEEDSKTMLRNQGKVSIRGKCVQPIEEDSSHIDDGTLVWISLKRIKPRHVDLDENN
ncbi:uncharacterized protein LOC143644587 isoform X3 [Tamandua tetradactyla]|uniref:uncharacterized protein LOC143644587 isoform X3 n=1 Tax=Tamandua tetradactyla TaxID=48850 RepID=UPI004053B25B